VVPVDGYALRLVAARTLYGNDRSVQASPSLAGLAPLESVLLVHRIDRDRIGVGDGEQVRVTSVRGTIELAVRADPATEQGTAFLAANRRGPGLGDLVDPAEAVTDLRVETLS
jgi:anaerobic selenocysteine-containing dehydrogenase